jgi:hypothetical protein
VSKHFQRYARYAMITMICLSVPNLLVLFGISAWLGGDAWYGMINDGRYFVGSKGRFTEVTAFKYYLSLNQIYTVFVGYAGLFVATLFALTTGLISWVKARLRSSAP